MRLNTEDVLTLKTPDVTRHNTKICPMFNTNTKEIMKEAGSRRPVANLVLALSIRHVSLFRRKINAVLIVRTCALVKANTKHTTEKGGRPKAARALLWWRPTSAVLVIALGKAHVQDFSTPYV